MGWEKDIEGLHSGVFSVLRGVAGHGAGHFGLNGLWCKAAPSHPLYQNWWDGGTVSEVRSTSFRAHQLQRHRSRKLTLPFKKMKS